MSCKGTNFYFSNANPTPFFLLLIICILVDCFFENVDISKLKYERTVFGYWTLCTKDNRTILMDMEDILMSMVISKF